MLLVVILCLTHEIPDRLESLDDLGARHAWLDDLLAFADDVWSLTKGSAHANADTTTASTAEAADANGPTRTAGERD